ncbi:MAG: tRNA (adenosine(37)-N6)-threonylcarbamoyltransferase complex dimerization subunit type 1 TsaB [Patescibacteria group bacterium]|nr:tRNA (adenosine(37)-N6)-threonylcarbamoyltransferase complex dimerization subunit type 1 TsaB [Patescibacteria group bacterium]
MANKMYLFIDTSQREYLILALLDEQRIVSRVKILSQGKQSDKILFYLDKSLNQQKIKLQNLTGVIVVQGPGSFVGLRVGISLANALGYSLKIPVVGTLEKDLSKIVNNIKKLFKKKSSIIVLAKYGQDLKIKKTKH